MDPITQQGLAGSAGAAGDGPPYVDDVFSTFLYAGNASSGSQTITNGIDLSGEGGLVWIKNRVATDENTLIDTERGASRTRNVNASLKSGRRERKTPRIRSKNNWLKSARPSRWLTRDASRMSSVPMR